MLGDADGVPQHRAGKKKARELRAERKADKRQAQATRTADEAEFLGSRRANKPPGGGGCCDSSADRPKTDKEKAKEQAPWYSTMNFRSVMMLLLMVGGALQVVVPAVAQLADLFVTHYEELDSSDPAVLHRVFFSGEAWAVLCHNGTGPVSAVFQEAASQSRTMTPRYAQPRWATFDCHRPLPSGKSTIERFGLFEGKDARVAFTVANGRRPEQVPAGLMHRGVVGRPQTPIQNAGAAMLKHVNSRTKLPPLKFASSSTQLESHCFNKRSCALLLYPGSRPDATARLQLQQLMSAHRLTRFVVVDAKKYMLDPLERKLPPVLGGVKAYPRLVYFRRNETAPAAAADAEDGKAGADEAKPKKKAKKGKKSKAAAKKVRWGAKSYRSHFSAPEVSVFLTEIEQAERAADTNFKMATLRRAPRLKTRPKKKKGKGKGKSKKDDDAGKAGEDKAAGKKGKKPAKKGDDKEARAKRKSNARRRKAAARKAEAEKAEAKRPNIKVKDSGAPPADAEQRRAQAEKERARRAEMEQAAREKYPHLAEEEDEVWDDLDDAEDDEADAADGDDGDDEDEIDLGDLGAWDEEEYDDDM